MGVTPRDRKGAASRVEEQTWVEGGGLQPKLRGRVELSWSHSAQNLQPVNHQGSRLGLIGKQESLLNLMEV